MNRTTGMLISLLILSSLSVAGCSKGGSEIKQVSPEEAKKNAELERTSPHAAPTVRGDIERINLAIQSSIDAYRHQKWTELVSNLNTARQETEKALVDPASKASVAQQTFGEMKTAIERAIQTAENRSSEVEHLLNDLQTRAGTLKMLLPPLPEPEPNKP